MGKNEVCYIDITASVSREYERLVTEKKLSTEEITLILSTVMLNKGQMSFMDIHHMFSGEPEKMKGDNLLKKFIPLKDSHESMEEMLSLIAKKRLSDGDITTILSAVELKKNPAKDARVREIKRKYGIALQA